MANADMLLGGADAADARALERAGGLFGGEDAAVDRSALEGRGRLVAQPNAWRPREARISASPSSAILPPPIARSPARKARAPISLMSGGVPGGGRMGAVMAVQVEGASKGTTKRGKPFIRADFSDASGQFSAACFEERLVEKFLEWAEEWHLREARCRTRQPEPRRTAADHRARGGPARRGAREHGDAADARGRERSRR